MSFIKKKVKEVLEGEMTEFQYLYFKNIISELRAEGIDTPNWNSPQWIKTVDDLGTIRLHWLGLYHVIKLVAEKERYGTYDLGSVEWLEKTL